MATIPIVLVDDHPITLAGIRHALRGAGDITIVAQTDSGQQAIELILLHRPQVVLLDIELPDISGLEVAKRIRQWSPQIRILILSGFVSPRYIHEALACGVAGYLTKEEPLQNIVEAIRGVARGERGWMSRSVAEHMSRLLTNASHELTPREREILPMIVAAKTNAEISQLLQISRRTVEKHVGSILGKLGATSRVDVAVRAVRLGLSKMHE